MRKKYFRIVLSTIMALAANLLCGCTEDEDAENPIPFIVYGIIMDYRTGEPVRAAEVELHVGTPPVSGLGTSSPEGSIGSAVTGTDGQYEMHCVITENLIQEIHNNYFLYIRANGHDPYTKGITMTVKQDVKVQQDASIY